MKHLILRLQIVYFLYVEEYCLNMYMTRPGECIGYIEKKDDHIVPKKIKNSVTINKTKLYPNLF